MRLCIDSVLRFQKRALAIKQGQLMDVVLACSFTDGEDSEDVCGRHLHWIRAQISSFIPNYYIIRYEYVTKRTTNWFFKNTEVPNHMICATLWTDDHLSAEKVVCSIGPPAIFQCWRPSFQSLDIDILFPLKWSSSLLGFTSLSRHVRRSWTWSCLWGSIKMIRERYRAWASIHACSRRSINARSY